MIPPEVEEQSALTDWLRPEGGATGPDVVLDARRTRALAIAERSLRRMAGERPLVLYLDDLQWGGQAALDALGYLLAMWRQVPARILTIACLRTPIDDRAFRHAFRKIAAHEGAQVERIRLDPLTTEESRKLIHAVLEDRATSLGSQIAVRAAGNPLFAIQLARLARDAPRDAQDPAAGGGGRSPGVAADRELRESFLPASVQQLIEARLEAAIARSAEPRIAEAVLGEVAILIAPAPTMLHELAHPT
jgi:hypothetical protein